MKYNILGKSGIKVSELCFGVLPMGPLQANVPVEEGARVILEGLKSGINFIDTAQMYGTYPYIREALKKYSGEVIIASKSHAIGYQEMKEAVLEACHEMNRDYIDIFHLHAARADKNIFQQRAGALSCLKDLKREGIVRAIGISTHAVEVVIQAAEEEEIDIVFPIINQAGLGIIGGTPEDMIHAIKKSYNAGKGIYAMKAFAGGYLINHLKKSIDYVRDIKEIKSTAVGMINSRELTVNLKIFENKKLEEKDLPQKGIKRKRLFVSGFCEGCGTCVEACPNGALSIRGGKANVDHNLCITCGYCVPHCPLFALRVV